MALVILGLFALPYTISDSVIAALFPISLSSALLAATTLLASVVFYFIAPRRNLSYMTLGLYVLLAVMIGSIIVTTGQSSSPLIGLWIGVTVFAGVFGWQGIMCILLLLLGYNTFLFLNQAPLNAVIVAVVATVAPLIASFIIWHSKSEKDTKQDKAYRELATELTHEANKSEIVINAINDGVIATDASGVIQLINPAATRIIGWGQNDAVGLSYESVIKLKDKADKPVTGENDPVAQVLATSQEVHSEDFSVTTEAGKKLLLSVVVSPLGHPANGAIIVFRDMTKEKAEGREQAEFISTASHEMRTPVASIEGYLGLALNPATATIDEKAREYIQKAQSSAQHLGRLFQDLLDVSRADDGRLNNKPTIIDTSAYISDIAEGLKPKAQEKNLNFVYQPAVDDAAAGDRKLMPVYYVSADKDHLREVISNLIENAIKYTMNGDVIINITGDDTHVTISVQDSGIGIPAEDIPHLFQKFYRVDNSDTREIGGTGLGLYLCRRLAEVMGGRMQVESEYKKGSTFSLVLPRIASSDAIRLKQAEEEAAAKEAAEQTTPVAPPTMPLQPMPQPQVAQPMPPAQQPPREELSTPFISTPLQQPVTQSQQPSALTPVGPQPVFSQPQPQPQQPTQYSQPYAQPQPQPQQMQVTQPLQQAPRPGQDIMPRRPVTPQAPNIPLSQLEQNAAAYAGRSGVQIPDRNQQY